MIEYDLAGNEWTLSGWTPELWDLGRSMELGHTTDAEIAPIRCSVPGSVQKALRAAGLLPDWNAGLNARACEWVENRHWIYETQLPVARGDEKAVLFFEGLDGQGSIYLDGKKVVDFDNSFLPVEVDLSGTLEETAGRKLRVVFRCPPRWLGQFGRTSEIREWKPRFNYTWDWIPRLVQTGIFGRVALRVGEPNALESIECKTTCDVDSGHGSIDFVAGFPLKTAARIVVEHCGITIASVDVPPGELPSPIDISQVAFWQPNGSGDPSLYQVRIVSADTEVIRDVGFRSVEWLPCENAPEGADPWLCRINGQNIFLQGINWTPIRPFFADLQREDYAQRLRLYRDLGFNLIRVWGGGFPEYDWLYELCDELGILVWQDFYLSSSGIENCPPDDPEVMAKAEQIMAHTVRRLRRHPCLLMWCGGNELQDMPAAPPEPTKPAGLDHPLLARLARIVDDLDPGRRFVPSTSSGPRFSAQPNDFGKGLHWDVHGPWRCDRVPCNPWQDYFIKDDALFRSEMGHPGAQGADLMRHALGDSDFFDARRQNPFWGRFGWWFDVDKFLEQWGGGNPTIEDYVAWSQSRQAEVLAFAVRAVKQRFPRCGGLILWMGHDSYPCPVNTSIVDYNGNPKPVCQALEPILKS